MQFPNDIDTLWEMWEQTVLNSGLNCEQAEMLGQQIEKLEEQNNPAEKHHDEPQVDALTKAHRIFDQLCSKKAKSLHNHSQPGNRVIKTKYGAIYENAIAVRGMERLLNHAGNGHQTIQLSDGFYHVNHLPGVQPTASEQVNARNKNVEKVDAQIVEQFISACKATGMGKRGWKKTVNEQFDMSRQEFTKWLLRYFPLFGLAVPIDKKS
ncbi:hypothetical protein [Aliiglaciecola litoralis]|uniref:Uncharacterized protein n=1 Tax=Aliiglaciecola litoralis TaxID=582857 RepID=A0ABN1LF68_9ALTE